MNKSRTNITHLLSQLQPFDETERRDIATTLTWVASGLDLYRLDQPDVPAKHLVSYVVVIDQVRKSVLLLEHIKAGLWLPSGGHVELNEDPYDTATRELGEELGSRAALVATVARLPLFVTVTKTPGVHNHTDVSLWYVVAGDVRMWIDPDPREFRSSRWWRYDEILGTNLDEFDPGMHRFLHKLQGRV